MTKTVFWDGIYMSLPADSSAWDKKGLTNCVYAGSFLYCELLYGIMLWLRKWIYNQTNIVSNNCGMFRWTYLKACGLFNNLEHRIIIYHSCARLIRHWNLFLKLALTLCIRIGTTVLAWGAPHLLAILLLLVERIYKTTIASRSLLLIRVLRGGMDGRRERGPGRHITRLLLLRLGE